MINGNDVEKLMSERKKFKFMIFSIPRFLSWLLVLPYYKMNASAKVKLQIMKKDTKDIILEAPGDETIPRMMFVEWLYRNNYKVTYTWYSKVAIKPISEMEEILYE